MKNNIRVERAVLRISQQQLAEAVGVSRQTIYAIENGKFIPCHRERKVHSLHRAGTETFGLFREDGQ